MMVRSGSPISMAYPSFFSKRASFTLIPLPVKMSHNKRKRRAEAGVCRLGRVRTVPPNHLAELIGARSSSTYSKQIASTLVPCYPPAFGAPFADASGPQEEPGGLAHDLHPEGLPFRRQESQLAARTGRPHLYGDASLLAQDRAAVHLASGRGHVEATRDNGGSIVSNNFGLAGT